MAPPALYDLNSFDLDRPLYTIDDIRRVNPQRDAMEQLTAIVHIDEENHGIVGYKDVTDREFWTTGHMPGFPLMPGVILCECAAQLAGFYARKFKLLGGDYLGFGGMDNVRFRSPVYPGDRLVVMIRASRIRPQRMAEFEFQGYVKDRLVFTGNMIGVPIVREENIVGKGE